ncbi:5-formyltetrahydrofolate cyclo-ligase [Sporosarcina sp. ANT_H38]|uniref:5-formyltetrahydrofolate cyclo-ligase n=1 Tax=Sporosarcina sp. ANT_H38 TaxID=2597358 RepID=UPI0011F1EEDB|nr:5-formyltetrahydrofolate cyclo-ligase [Sporosarcina sp. ANT_H38]KAA0966062.1 5-formyltetrahydrofolate cyclo-ligase [Sporosarcina sp. ANT_H38]
MSKIFLRNQVLDTLNNMSRTEHIKKSLEITDRVLASNEFRSADTIGITISRYPEVDTRPLIEAAWVAGKQIAVPKCIHATRKMDFRLITSYDSLETVYMGLFEPILNETITIEKEGIDLQIVPGIVFSDEGYRIGFGGGYYDRYMSDYNGDTLSLAFASQTSKSVPIEGHDIPVSKIFTEEKLILCQKRETTK